MSPSALIRPAEPADADAMAAIYADAVANLTATFELESPSAADFASRVAQLHRSGHPWLVADAEGTLLGYAYAAPARVRPGWRFTVENSIYVAPQARQTGIGRRLLNALIGACAAQGFRQMIAAIGDSDNAASIALHRRAGFEEVGVYRAVGRKHGRWLDVVLMQIALGDGASTPPPGE